MCVAEGEKTIFMLKEKAVLKLHNRAINQRSDGRYITKVKYNDSVIMVIKIQP